jgi:drug/metabolite transporter (DMT)-like permease
MVPPLLKSWQTCALLACANLFWAGNWVVGRALRDVYPPVTLNFWRWLLAGLILVPFALPLARGKWHLVRRHAILLALLAATGGALFQSMVYVGLRSTTTVNAVLISSSAPLFVMLCSWVLERQKAGGRQLLGMVVSFTGVLAILGKGDPAMLLGLDMQGGDVWILAAMPIWGVYSVLLKRVPIELRGNLLLFAMAALSVPMLAAPSLMESRYVVPVTPLAPGALLGMAYVALFASVLAFTCWNRAVSAVGANVAGLSLPLMPLFGTVLAMMFLGEELRPFHLAGIATILAGIAVATRGRTQPAARSSRPAAAPAVARVAGPNPPGGAKSWRKRCGW